MEVEFLGKRFYAIFLCEYQKKVNILFELIVLEIQNQICFSSHWPNVLYLASASCIFVGSLVSLRSWDLSSPSTTAFHLLQHGKKRKKRLSGTIKIPVDCRSCDLAGALTYCILSPCLFNLYAEYIMRNAGLEEPEIKLPTSAGSSKKQESSRKTSISALLTMPKPLTV